MGSVQVYTGHGEGASLQLTVVPLGKVEDRVVLAHFKVPRHAMDNYYGVYKGECQTTQCDKITYKMIGGISYGMIEYGGYSGKHYSVILAGQNQPIRLSYSAKLSKSATAESVRKRYLASIGRLEDGLSDEKAIGVLLKEGTQIFHESCESKAPVILDRNAFAKEKLLHLTGMGKYFLTELASVCKDKDYRKVISKITEIAIVPSARPKPISLVDQKLTLYLTPETYNPADEAKAWIQKL